MLRPKCFPKKEIKVEKHSKALKTQILVFANLMRLWQPCFTSHEELDIKEAILPLWLKSQGPDMKIHCRINSPQLHTGTGCELIGQEQMKERIR